MGEKKNAVQPGVSEEIAAKDKVEKKRFLYAAVIFAAVLALASPVSEFMNSLTSGITVVRLDWGIPFRLVMLVAGLTMAAAVSSLLFNHWLPKTGQGKTMFTIAHSAMRYVLGILGLLWGLAIVGVDVSALLAGAGVVALIIGFGAESLIADVITGVFMLFEHQYEVGDIIVVDNFRGTVTQIGIRTTSITDTGGNVKIINNSDIRNLINRSASKSVAVCDLGVLYEGVSVRKAEAILEEAMPKVYEEHRDVFLESPRYLGVQTLSLPDNAAILRVIARVEESNIYSAQRIMNRELMMALEDAGVSNPPAEVVVQQLQ